MGKLIGDLIDFTRTHLGSGIPVHVARGNLVAVCQEVVNESRAIRPEMVIELHSPTRLEATFDADRIVQALSNIIGNALQYGDRAFPVRVSVTSDDKVVVISVNNRGPVIPPDQLSSIFDPMVRIATPADTNGSERTSLGLGLYIAREIVHAHTGQIKVESNAIDGTTFDTSIPLGQPRL